MEIKPFLLIRVLGRDASWAVSRNDGLGLVERRLRGDRSVPRPVKRGQEAAELKRCVAREADQTGGELEAFMKFRGGRSVLEIENWYEACILGRRARVGALIMTRVKNGRRTDRDQRLSHAQEYEIAAVSAA